MRISVLFRTFLGLSAFVWATRTLAASAAYWNWRNPVPQGNDYNAVAYGGGQFVAVGRAGTITTSIDGVSWAAANSGRTGELASIAYGNGRFVVVGFGLSGALISDDGQTWTSPATSLPDGGNRVTAVTYAGDRFFAMSNQNYTATLSQNFVATSTDGVTWTKSESASNANVGRIAANSSGYVGQNLLTGILQSPDGVTWTDNEAKMLRSTDGVTWVAGGGTGLAAISAGPVYFDGRWVVGGTLVTQEASGKMFWRALSTSTDGGSTWTVAWHETVTHSSGNALLDGLGVFGGRLFLSGYYYDPISSTADFATFREDLPTQMVQLKTFAASSSRIVVVGRYGQIVTSPDGAVWTSLASNTVTGNLRAAAFGSGTWIVAGDAGLAASPDGIAWRMLPGTAIFNAGSVAYGNGHFVAGAYDGRIGVSNDGGVTWQESSKRAALLKIAFAHDVFVGSRGLISSTDGLTWSAEIAAPGGTGSWTGVFAVDDVFYAIGTTDPTDEKNGVIARSTDGVTWTTVATMPERLISVGGKNGLLIACGQLGEIWRSTDGITWTRVDGRPLLPLGPAASTLWVGDSLVATTLSGNVLLSEDGISWTKDDFASSGTMLAMAAGNGQIIAVGIGGVIWEVGAARFTREPESRTVALGNPVTFSVAAVGKEPLSYQWQKNGSPISGAKTKAFSIASAQAVDAGNYAVVVSNSLGSTASGSAALVVSQSSPQPIITTQPESKSVTAGGAVTFGVAATGTGTLRYQWLKDNVAITGATGSSYTIPAANASDNGTYSVVISDSAGSVTSNNFTLTVTPPPTSAQLVNIATRAYATTENGVTIGGFVIAGHTPKQVLMRAVGPTLLKQGIGAADLLADPLIELHHGADTLASNDNWGDNANHAEIAATGLRIGAAPFDAADTKSAALLMTLDPGIYTFIAKGKNATSGIVLLEVYDADSAGATFVNIATRARCTTGDGVAIGGFVISGNAAKQVLMRAVGPTLSKQGLASAEVLLDPTMELHQGAATLATNDNWGDNANAAAIGSVGSRIGAMPFDESDTKSSALLMTLQPGVYSFIVRGKNATSGLVLVEVYDAD